MPSAPDASTPDPSTPALASADPPALRTRRLAKRYGWGGRAREALAGVDLEVPRGAVIGLLGANGAGKSTLVRIALGLARASAGEVSVLGAAGPPSRAARARIGFLPEDSWLPPQKDAAGALAFFGALAGLDRREARARAAALSERLDLGDAGRERTEVLSKGTRRRLGIAAALLGRPDLIVLDEPTDGVDPVGRVRVRELLAEERARGAAVLLSSHVLSEVEQMADGVTVLARGRVALQGGVRELTAAGGRYALRVADASPTSAFREALALAARAVEPGPSPDAFVIDPGGERALDAVVRAAIEHGGGLRELRPLELRLEDAVIDALGGGPSALGGGASRAAGGQHGAARPPGDSSARGSAR